VGILIAQICEQKMKTAPPTTASMKFYTIEQIAESLDASTRSVRRWIANGAVTVETVGEFELKPAFTRWHAEFRRGLRDSDIAISSLSWFERGCHGAPGG
jgi:hypothetical protein